MKQFGSVGVVLALGLALGALIWYTGGDDSPARTPGEARGVPVEVVAVEQRDLTERARFSGSLMAATRVGIAPRITGRLDYLHVDLGDVVESGEILAELDDEEFRQELAQVRAELLVARASTNEAEAALAAAERRLRRTRELREQRVASESELEAAETELQAERARLELAQAQVSQREAAVRAAEIRLGYSRIRADRVGDGATRLVAERLADPGTIVQANEPILTLVDLDPLRGVVFATEREYARLQRGQTVLLRSDAHPDETFEGRVARIAPVFGEDSRQARVEIEIPNPDHRLRPGMFVDARVITGSREQATTVPAGALLERDGTRGVFRLERDDDRYRARFVPVTTGVRDGQWVEVQDPDLDGRVVTLGRHLLTDGTPVQVAEEPAATAEHTP
ncbi:efflux RND transporter periplasmic adaptor subunit [Aquisalimonas sp.]|uniref:efflux RND transporter periplasmic adaptor subunit n=1 Tax=unclassified Aquisalimonas TaxID=2644645 RepID=UPI0025BA2784|nr:efflux RND transporter periplasmic adaptor subunit [Aquisalimonas sp.]